MTLSLFHLLPWHLLLGAVLAFVAAPIAAPRVLAPSAAPLDAKCKMLSGVVADTTLPCELAVFQYTSGDSIDCEDPCALGSVTMTGSSSCTGNQAATGITAYHCRTCP